MAGSRLELHSKLCELLGSTNVYFQPPETIKMKYPCIVYERSSGNSLYADNKLYRFLFRYTITVIDKDPDNPVVEKIIEEFPKCRYDRRFIADNLNHDLFELYY